MDVAMANVDTVDPGGKTVTPDEEVQLREENRLLQGKVRGYATLGKLLQESKEEVKTLKDFQKKYEDLVMRMSESDQRSVLKDDQLSAVKNMEVPSVMKASVLSEGTTIASEDLFGSGPNKKVTNDESLPEAVISVVRAAIPEDNEAGQPDTTKYPTQESMHAVEGSEESSPPIESPLGEDADCYEKEENKYTENQFAFSLIPGVKMHNQLTTTEGPEKMDFVHVSYGPSSPRSPDIVFPELNSRTDIFSSFGHGTGNEFTARAASELLPDNQNRTPNFPMLSPNPTNEEELSMKISKLANNMHASPWALEFQKISENALNIERKEKAAKAIAGTLIENMKHLEARHLIILHEKDREIQQLRRESYKVKKLERERDIMTSPESEPGSVSSQTEVVDWVNVDPQRIAARLKTEEMQKNSSTINAALQQKLHTLILERNKCVQVNVNWERLWKEKKISYETKIESLKIKVTELHKTIADNMAGEERRIQDYDRLILDAKRKAEDILMTKEESLRKLDGMTARCGAMGAKIQDLEQQLMIVQQEKASRSPSSQTQSHSAPLFSAASNTTIKGLQTDNTVLRQQLTVFQEDFDKERTDRAMAQSLKDDLQTKLNDSIKQMKSTEMQLKGAENTLLSAREEISRMKHENQTLKNRVRNLSDREAQGHWMPQPPPNHTAAQREQYWYAQQTAQPISTQHRQPQLLPGAWACARCTVVNYPGRTVCEVCGQIQPPQVTRPQNPPGYVTGHPTTYGQQNLTSRGQAAFAGNDVPDLDLTEDSPG